MNEALMAFLVYYMLYRRHSGMRKELRVKTPFQAVEKPEIFKQDPCIFKNKILCLQPNKCSSFHQQHCET
ncbi:MAG: hypothetical protein STSR0006_14780 [Lentimicrobium sp.]